MLLRRAQQVVGHATNVGTIQRRRSGLEILDVQHFDVYSHLIGGSQRQVALRYQSLVEALFLLPVVGARAVLAQVVFGKQCLLH